MIETYIMKYRNIVLVPEGFRPEEWAKGAYFCLTQKHQALSSSFEMGVCVLADKKTWKTDNDRGTGQQTFFLATLLLCTNGEDWLWCSGMFQSGSWGWPAACIFLKLSCMHHCHLQPKLGLPCQSWDLHDHFPVARVGLCMSTRSARLTRANSAKQTLRSSRGFGSRPDRTTRESRPVDRCDPVEEQRPVTSPAPHREICSICLEALDDSCFNYPCGQNHRLHYGCMIHFLGSILALPLSDDTPGPLLKEQVRDLGQGWKAIGVTSIELYEFFFRPIGIPFFFSF